MSMTDPENSPESPKTGLKGFKVTLMQGIIGATTLAATTAIPILVQRALSPQPPVTPAQVLSAPNDASNASLQSPSGSTQLSPEASLEQNRDRKNRKKKD
jgi:hypothetical protein